MADVHAYATNCPMNPSDMLSNLLMNIGAHVTPHGKFVFIVILAWWEYQQKKKLHAQSKHA